MPNSIYDQLGQGLGQAVKYGRRSILYRGKVIACAVLLGNTSTKLTDGGLQTQAVVHVLIAKELIPSPQDGEPHTNERVVYPAVPMAGLNPRELMVHEAIGQEWDWALTLIDPSQ